ncbi:nucleolar protein 58 isoform X2 [Brachypodium distachyon]|uniref:nucleolar protein 58 isoform X2 n=1 Tax=Brachypodium distachyon TaxID=15368 RepID=UPI0001D44085|nr:nucleolar protein 58 isoform X2 [Brachypodium distachyon]|eukprot:XP_014751699.1 nucleolar protein 58 isoform X2 [Brachypodium distachyon]
MLNNMPHLLLHPVMEAMQANRVVEVDEMWRAREKELELESKMKNRYKDHGDSRSKKHRSDSRNQSSSSRIAEDGIAYNSSYSDQDDGLGDDEIEKFLHSRVKRGRGAVGSRMDEPGPYLKASSHSQDNEPGADTRLEEKWERRVQGPERPLFLRSKSPDDYWHKEMMEGEPSSSEAQREKEHNKEKKSEKKERREKKDKKSKHRRHRHHHHKSRRRE